MGRIQGCQMNFRAHRQTESTIPPNLASTANNCLYLRNHVDPSDDDTTLDLDAGTQGLKLFGYLNLRRNKCVLVLMYNVNNKRPSGRKKICKT